MKKAIESAIISSYKDFLDGDAEFLSLGRCVLQEDMRKRLEVMHGLPPVSPNQDVTVTFNWITSTVSIDVTERAPVMNLWPTLFEKEFPIDLSVKL